MNNLKGKENCVKYSEVFFFSFSVKKALSNFAMATTFTSRTRRPE